MKDIAVILDDKDISASLEILAENIARIDEEITALDVIRSVIKLLAEKPEERRERFDMLEDKEIAELSETLILSKRTLKEEHFMSSEKTVKELNEAQRIKSERKRPQPA